MCEEFSEARCDYLYTRRPGKHKLLHFTPKENANAIISEGINLSGEYCDVGCAVYAYDVYTPAADVFPLITQNKGFNSPFMVFLFETDGVYQCVHSKDTAAPLRYCVVRERIERYKIVDWGYDPVEFLEPMSALNYLERMGYPAELLLAYKCGEYSLSIAEDCAVLNGNKDREGVEGFIG